MTIRVLAAVLVVSLAASPAAAQNSSPVPAETRPKADGLWNGALVGAGIGALGTAFMLGQCGDGEPDCQLITSQVGFFGVVPASALIGALIDRGVVRREVAAARRDTDRQKAKGDPLWNGVLIGAAGGVGAAFWFRRANCGPVGYDDECSAIAAPVGALIFVPSGMAVGALIDHFIHKPASPSPSPSRASFAPAFGRKRIGASVVWRF